MYLREGAQRLGLLMKRIILPLTVAGLMLVVGCKSPASSESSAGNAKANESTTCTEPENPYDDGSGHYAGYEWAEQSGTGTCGGKSQSFNEGCEEYENQEAEYQECEDKKQN
jgi:hypothetical protein